MERGFIHGASRSLAGHMVLAALFTALPAYVVFMGIFLFEGKLTPARAFYVAIIVSVGAVSFAAIFWFLISKPLIKSRVR